MKNGYSKKYVFSAFFSLCLFGALAAQARAATPGDPTQLQGDISNVSQKISQLPVGAVVTNSLNSELQDIQSSSQQALQFQTTDAAKSQAIIEGAETRLKKLDQLVDLSNGAAGDYSQSSTAELQNLNRDISVAQDEISKVALSGGDATSMKSTLQNINAVASLAQGKINSDDMPGANILLRQARKSLDSLDDSADGALDIAFDGSRKTSRDYAASVAEVSADLESLSTIDPEPGIGNQIGVIANSQYASIAQVQKLIAAVAKRQGFVKFLIGSDAQSVNKLSDQVEVDKKDIDSLTALQSKISDSAAGAILQSQIQILQQQTAALEAYIQINAGGYSLFGWFLKYL